MTLETIDSRVKNGRRRSSKRRVFHTGVLETEIWRIDTRSVSG